MDLEKVTVNLDHLRQEVSTMKLCKHENVLTLYNCFTVKSSLWLIMPFMNMGSCLEVMKQLKLKGVMELKEEWISAILSGAVEGMAYLLEVQSLKSHLYYHAVRQLYHQFEFF